MVISGSSSVMVRLCAVAIVLPAKLLDATTYPALKLARDLDVVIGDGNIARYGGQLPLLFMQDGALINAPAIVVAARDADGGESMTSHQ